MPSIGIDLGTTNSCVAVVENGEVDVLANDMGNRITPSCIAFLNGERMVGEDAKEERKCNPENSVWAVKRFMGREPDEETVVKDRRKYPFEIINAAGRLKFQIHTNEDWETFFPEQISGFILEKMGQVAQDRIGEVFNAVITIPAYFNNAQRGATEEAAKLAGLHVLQLLHEPTAAAIAYCFQRQVKSKRTVLVYDLGGGTFDVSLLSITGENFKVIATGGDTHLGGEDFDLAMAECLATEFESQKNVNITNDKVAMAKLTEKCERAKTFLSKNLMQRIETEVNGEVFRTQITRSTFEDLNRKLFEQTFEILEKVLKDGKMEKSEIDDVVLAGGSVRIPFITKRLEMMFGERKIRKSINPDEAVAYGAALYAAHLSGEEIPRIGDINLQDVTPLSLGIEIKGGLASVIIKRNTSIPTRKEGSYETTSDNQTVVRFEIFEGERAMIRDNHRLGSFRLLGVPPKPAGEAKLVVRFSLSESGILDISAFETTTGNHNCMAIELDKKRFTEEEIENMKRLAERYKKQDDDERAKILAVNELERMISKFKRTKDSRKVQIKCEEAEKWLKDNKDARREEVMKKRSELEAYVSTQN